jgi:hypothetical protein
VELARRQLQECQATEHQSEVEVERQRRLLDWHKGRLGEYEDDRAAAESEMQLLGAAIADHETRVKEARSRVRALGDELTQLSLEEAQENATYWAMRVAVTQQALESALLRSSEQLLLTEKLIRQSDELHERMEQTTSALAQLDGGAAWMGGRSS